MRLPSLYFCVMRLDLSPRLAAVAAWVPEGSRLADVGTDHAYLPAFLLSTGRIPEAIATDLNPDPVARARETALAFGLLDRLDVRLCDGLSALSPEECDVISICGLGGETMAGILERTPWAGDKRLILEPQSTQEVLRRFLQANGYAILAERAVREGEHWYPVLLVQAGEMPPLSPGEALAGRWETWVSEPERPVYLQWLLHRAMRQLEGMSHALRPPDEGRREDLLGAVAYLREHLAEM